MEMHEQEFRDLLSERTEEVEEIIRRYLPQAGPEESEAGAETQSTPDIIVEAMNYSVLGGGKRIRPILMLEMYRVFRGSAVAGLPPVVDIKPYIAAIEMIHAYSLVHDDLPAMDNDEYRRGKKTTWAVYGEGMGVLAGDALLNYAFETTAKVFESCAVLRDFLCAGRALQVLSGSAGIYGMIGGQVADVEGEKAGGALTEEEILYIHIHKTGALIRASMQIGAILAGVLDDELLEQIDKAATNIGIAFQIQDDILDVIGDSEEMGKTAGSDAANGKTTYVTIKGLEESAKEVKRLSDEALRIVETFPGDHRFLEALIIYLINRRR